MHKMANEVADTSDENLKLRVDVVKLRASARVILDAIEQQQIERGEDSLGEQIHHAVMRMKGVLEQT